MMKPVIALAICLAISACSVATPPPPPAYLMLAGDPHRRVPAVRAGNVSAGTRDFRIVEPRDWMQINRDIAPEQKETPQ